MFRAIRIEKKLDLLLYRQTMMEIFLQNNLSFERCKKIENKWNKLWHDIMEKKNETKE